MKKIKVALCGQPNVGKSALFNVLTNKRVQVANWPGTTVEKHEGSMKYGDYIIEFVDLPGIYGFSSITLEERIARKYILSGEPDVILVLIDSIYPERTMYLAIQVAEITSRVIFVFTKSDLTHVHGIHIDYDKLENRLKIPVVPVSVVSGRGIDYLIRTIIDVYEGRRGRSGLLEVDYRELEPFINSIVGILNNYRDRIVYPLKWLAVRLLEGDKELEEIVERILGKSVMDEIRFIRVEATNLLKRDLVEITSQYRFQYISSLLDKIVIRTRIEAGKADRFSRLFYNPWLGSLLSLLILISVFILVFILNTGFPLSTLLNLLGYGDLAEIVEEYSLSSLMDKLISITGDALVSILGENLITKFIVEAVLNGVGAVLVFLPLILLVSFFLAVLEDSGLAPRIAVSTQIFLEKLGLSGHAIFPITLSLGCNVPSILSTRAIPDHRERFRLLLTTPFIPCQARLVVILAFASALKRFSSALLIIYSYAVAFIIFMLINKLLYVIDLRRGYAVSPELVLEVPPIHRPIPRVVWWITWINTRHFLRKAGLIIFSASIVIWFLTNYSPSFNIVNEAGESIAATIAKIFTPLLQPIGIVGENSWVIALSLLIGFVAKELVISTLLVSTGSSSMRMALDYIGLSDPQIAAITTFTVLYVPCLATLSAFYGELRSVKYTLLLIFIMITVGYIAMLSTYLISSLFY